MRFHRFWVKTPINKGGVNTLSNPHLVHQLRRVFRLHEGDKAIFFDGSGDEHVSDIVSMDDETLSFRVLETRSVKRLSDIKVSLAASLIKKDNFEWVIQKGTELGVSEFIPLISDRSEKKGFNMERAQKIMIEAVEQSGRVDVPTISEPQSFEDFLDSEKCDIVAFHTEGTNFDIKVRAEFVSKKEIIACVGPEGGWTDEEVEAFKKKGASVVKLNTPILRAETAAVAVATLFLA
jgi:16S rRNA (uracil1498-N3)-methyltransferase